MKVVPVPSPIYCIQHHERGITDKETEVRELKQQLSSTHEPAKPIR